MTSESIVTGHSPGDFFATRPRMRLQPSVYARSLRPSWLPFSASCHRPSGAFISRAPSSCRPSAGYTVTARSSHAVRALASVSARVSATFSKTGFPSFVVPIATVATRTRFQVLRSPLLRRPFRPAGGSMFLLQLSSVSFVYVWIFSGTSTRHAHKQRTHAPWRHHPQL